MSDLISKSEALKQLCCCGCRKSKEVACGAPCDDYRAISRMPTIDAVEVIRCKDCENFGCSPFSYSPSKGWCKLEGEPRRADYYCASAEKRNKAKAGE